MIVIFNLISVTIEMDYYNKLNVKPQPDKIKKYIEKTIQNYGTNLIFLNGNITDLNKTDFKSSENEYKTLTKYKIMHNIINCKFVEFVYILFKKNFISSNDNNNNLTSSSNIKDNKKYIQLLMSILYKKINIIISMLFYLGDYFSSVESSQPYFIKTLLSLLFYLDTLKLSLNTTEIPNTWIIQRVIFKIFIEIEWFTIGYCPSSDCNSCFHNYTACEFHKNLQFYKIMSLYTANEKRSSNYLITKDDSLLKKYIINYIFEENNSQFVNIFKKYDFKQITINAIKLNDNNVYYDNDEDDNGRSGYYLINLLEKVENNINDLKEFTFIFNHFLKF